MALDAAKVVVVGGSSGIGLGVATAVLERGAEVVLVGRSQERLQNAVRELGEGAHITTISADVTNEEDLVRMLAEVGSFDHLVVTSGFPRGAPIASIDLDEVRALVEVLLIGAISLVKHAQGKLRVGGSITLTSGISVDRPSNPGGFLVAAVGGSLSYLVRALALELAPTRINVVSPGWVETPIWDALAGEAKTTLWEEMASRLPAGRISKPADVALAYLFLMESELTTGITLSVNGGHSLI